MITPTQKQEIRNYLLSRKIPIDILLEVEDHFISQILETQKTKNLGFNEAFINVKSVWSDDLRMKYSFWLHVYVPNFVMKLMRKEFSHSAKIAILFSSLLVLLSVLLAKFTSYEVFMTSYFVINLVVLVVPILVLIFLTVKRYAFFTTSYKSMKYSIYQKNLVYITLGFIFQIEKIISPDRAAEKFIRYVSSDFLTLNYFIFLISVLVLTAVSIFGFLNLIRHQKTVTCLKKQFRTIRN